MSVALPFWPRAAAAAYDDRRRGTVHTRIGIGPAGHPPMRSTDAVQPARRRE
jgi:hypothetical protein